MTRNAHIISCSLTILYCRNNDAPALVLKLGRQRQVCHILSLPPCLTASPLFGGWDTLWENICWCTTSPKSGMPRPFPWILPLLGLATLPPSWTFVDATADIVQAQNSGNLQAKYWTYISITVPRTVFFFLCLWKVSWWSVSFRYCTCPQLKGLTGTVWQCLSWYCDSSSIFNNPHGDRFERKTNTKMSNKQFIMISSNIWGHS